jgi:uncharacterized membrane protein YbhN (UPF0104 family)
MKRLEGRVPLSGIIKRCWEAVESYRSQPGALLKGFLISVPTHLLACLGVYLAMTTVQSRGISLESFLLVVPLGLITTAIPLSPAGVGIGQAAFYTLFSAVAAGTGTTASSGFTVYQSLQIAVFLTGLVSYLGWSNARSEATGVA